MPYFKPDGVTYGGGRDNGDDCWATFHVPFSEVIEINMLQCADKQQLMCWLKDLETGEIFFCGYCVRSNITQTGDLDFKLHLRSTIGCWKLPYDNLVNKETEEKVPHMLVLSTTGSIEEAENFLKADGGQLFALIDVENVSLNMQKVGLDSDSKRGRGRPRKQTA